MTPTVKDERGAWKYGDAHDRWPVEDGERWQVGEHLVQQADLEAGEWPLLAEAGPEVVVWTDPPWGSGNARTFRTKAAVDGADGGRAVDWTAFQHLNVCLWTDRLRAAEVWVEMGKREEAGLVAIAADYGLGLVSSTGITYYRKSPCRLLRFRPGYDGPVGVEQDWDGMDEWDLPGLCVERSVDQGFVSSSASVVDPCTGQGLVPERVAQTNGVRGWGLRFRGTELSRHRMAVTLDRLGKVVGEDPRRVLTGGGS